MGVNEDKYEPGKYDVIRSVYSFWLMESRGNGFVHVFLNLYSIWSCEELESLVALNKEWIIKFFLYISPFNLVF